MVGFSHSGWGLQVPATTLPTYDMPKFDGIGANEYIVDVVHGACDFISAVDTPVVWELNIWYHTLNCGYTCRISGETDFPCIYGEQGRPGPGLRQAATRISRSTTTDWVVRHPRRPQLLLRRAEPSVRFHGRRAGRRREGRRRTGQRAGRQERASRWRFASAPRPCWTKSRATISAQSRSTRNRTGTSSGPASATRARCRSS